jgi:hypothetical protein
VYLGPREQDPKEAVAVLELRSRRFPIREGELLAFAPVVLVVAKFKPEANIC